MHWCMDETLMVMMALPIIGIFFRKLHTWWHKRSHHKCHQEGCNAEHVEHTPVVNHDEEWFMDDWTSVEAEYVEARFGGSIMDDLMGDLRLLQVDERPHDEEFNWFVNEIGDLRCQYKARIFVHDYNCCEHGWDEVLH